MSYCLYTPNKNNKKKNSKRNYLHFIIKTHERKCWVAIGDRFIVLVWFLIKNSVRICRAF